MMGYQSSHEHFAISCSSSDLMNGRKPQFSSRTPFGVTINEDGISKPSFKWRRVLLKVSGEALAGDQLQNIDPKVTMAIAREVASVTRLGIEKGTIVEKLTEEVVLDDQHLRHLIGICEVNAGVVLKATNVDRVYNDDPRHNPNPYLLDTLTYNEVPSKELSVMDLTAITLCQENNIPVVVFNLNKTGNISKATRGEIVGTLIRGTQNSATARA